ncbi:hypothetical protein SLEP1_g22151 [Rubroshorea leprosula]|uniref:Secreted protein n=2 Tax=Rubroshorea leprosula TaxID=152421 RepID=A0AAV5JKB3_9ROSI|nr:hypothetical protein SLEP1_g22151 [Rubroshorea leprosula]
MAELFFFFFFLIRVTCSSSSSRKPQAPRQPPLEKLVRSLCFPPCFLVQKPDLSLETFSPVGNSRSALLCLSSPPAAMWVGDFWAFSEFSAIAAGSLTSQARFLQLGILVC